MKLPVTNTNIQLRFADLDALGHISNNVYPDYFELARVHWRDSIPSNDCPAAVVANINIDFTREIRLDDKVEITTSCIKKGGKSLVLAQDLYANDVLAAKATVTMVGFDLKTRQSCELPEAWETSEVC